MELHIQSDFDCVYLINGELSDRADSLTMSEYDVVYVTVFPIDIRLLPYTVKLEGADNIKNSLAVGVRLSAEHYLLHLAPRLPVLYGNADSFRNIRTPSRIGRLFSHVKNGDMTAAFAMLTENLKSSISENALEAFFSACERVAECTWSDGNNFYLIPANGLPRLCSYTLKDEFIDDLSQCDE
ncbi:MAG: hypothetical protein OSJ83_03900 [Clostridia bacterium]|nr:hypothetical protein [Clostridia bacterium]